MRYMCINLISSYLLDELDKILALVGIIFSLILIFWIKLGIGHPILVLVGVFCFIFCIGYLIIRNFFYTSLIPSLEDLKCSTRVYITLNILFFLLLSYSIISIYLRPDPYIRPLSYFISIALMAVIVSNEILFLSPQKSHVYFSLCKIIIIGLSLQYSQVLIFQNVLWGDPWVHRLFTIKIINEAYIPEGFAYSKLPLMHLMIGMTSLVTDLGYKMAAMFSISFLQVVSDSLFVFLLGKFLISNKVGLMAALLLEIANYHIFFGYVAIPNTMAAILILPIIFILFKLRKDKLFIGNLVLMFLMGTLILTHTISALCLDILLFVFWISYLVYSRVFNQAINRSVTLKMCILYTTTMLAYWTYVSGHILFLVNLIKLGFYSQFNLKYISLSFIPFWEQILTYLGMFLFFSLSFIGCLYMVSKQFRNVNRVILTSGGIVILCITFFSVIMEKYIIVSRWYYFSQILLAIPLSLSLFLINGIFKHRLIKGFIMSISIFVLCFFLIMNPVANMDNRIFTQKSRVRYAFTDSELKAGNTISKIYNERIGTDYLYTLLFRYQLDTKIIRIGNSLETGDFRSLQEIMIIMREETMNYPISRKHQGTLTINYDPFLALEEQNFSRIYNCGSVSGYLQP